VKLVGKVAVITGASSGIGEGVAERFLKEGAKVIGCGIEECMKFTGEETLYIKSNLTDYSEAEKIVKKGIEKFGKIDFVINCAGVTGVGNIKNTSPEEFQRQFDINVLGTFNMCKAAIDELEKQPGSAIVNIASDLGVNAIPDRVAYCPSKAAVIMLTKCLAIDHAPKIRANAILPGLVETPMIKGRIEESENPEEFRSKMAEIYPLKRIGTTKDMADAAVFLVSDDSSFITGEALPVCGGSQI
jgi:NAD(P)-dependent dehydrogenase (short-subunit alcohol dehydrogenase family)